MGNIIPLRSDFLEGYQLDHLLEMQTDVFDEHAQKNRSSLTVNDWDEMATISRRIAVIKGLQYDVTGGKY